MTVTVRGIEFQANLDNDMGLEFVNLSHRFGYQCPNWPYFDDVDIKRKHYMAKIRCAEPNHHHHDARHNAHRCPRPRRTGHAVH